MKKILGFLFVIVILGCGGYFVYVNYIKSKVPKLNLEEEVSNASKYYVYGNHFNIEGNIDIKDKNYDSLCLTLYNGEDKDIEITSDIAQHVPDHRSCPLHNGLVPDRESHNSSYLPDLHSFFPPPGKQTKLIIQRVLQCLPLINTFFSYA